jgi:succinate dehydrogenase/fumarate reductase flavoprotein subunit
MPLPQEADVVVIGAGAAGLAAAASAAALGLDIVVLEKERQFGGTSALSGAAIWIPLHARSTADDAAAVHRYLDALAGPADRARREAFVAHAGAALAFLEARTELHYTPRHPSPDYHMELPGAAETGRVLDVASFDGRRLGRRLGALRLPMPAHLVFGGMMVNRADVQALLGFGHRLGATRHALVLVLRYLRDRLAGWPRGTRLVVGSALVAALAATLERQGVPLILGARVERLTRRDDRVDGIELAQGARIRARLAVVLATGGFPGNTALSRAHRDSAAAHFSMASPSADGGGIALAQAVGGVLAETGKNPYFRAPVSVHRRDGKEIARIAHLVLDRAKPGIIAVDRKGRRFTNEADSYHRFGEALSRLPAAGDAPVAWLICDARALRRYGLGLARPAPARRRNRRLVRDGYLVEAPSIAVLAERIGVPADSLAATGARHAQAAADGVDPDFGKGASAHNRGHGDPRLGPNPCLAPLTQAPFYAVGLYSGDLGTARGLATSPRARVLDAAGGEIPGLYAVGNDMHSIMGGTYPAAGITLGPALVFAWIAAQDIAEGARA